MASCPEAGVTSMNDSSLKTELDLKRPQDATEWGNWHARRDQAILKIKIDMLELFGVPLGYFGPAGRLGPELAVIAYIDRAVGEMRCTLGLDNETEAYCEYTWNCPAALRRQSRQEPAAGSWPVPDPAPLALVGRAAPHGQDDRPIGLDEVRIQRFLAKKALPTTLSPEDVVEVVGRFFFDDGLSLTTIASRLKINLRSVPDYIAAYRFHHHGDARPETLPEEVAV
jgi:hypothetical protein